MAYQNNYPEETLAALLKSDDVLKTKGVAEQWNKLADQATIDKTVAALKAKNHLVTVVENREQAFNAVKAAIPAGASVSNGHSTTLEEIGFITYLKEATEYNNFTAKMLKEEDPVKAGEIKRQGYSADYFLSSVTAVTEDGKFAVADLSGTRVSGFLPAKNVIIVAGTNKIVKDSDAAWKRTVEFALDVESARVRLHYKVPASQINNYLLVESGFAWAPPRYHIILIKEQLGY
ncbi:hypothetical protein BC938DRAFT_476254 [Jimgerdemannia flammicorona]|uniref:LUD domain-containing protein n=1 Tax=Jimgerdemannia flammicorona TaxID=994334 RepID=A0A433QQR9_9FUNG|nr:hypothetical protein BC938DRAFT_476254 [Jimgerdemannia flammicorona]